jgi:hypothetical protein
MTWVRVCRTEIMTRNLVPKSKDFSAHGSWLELPLGIVVRLPCSSTDQLFPFVLVLHERLCQYVGFLPSSSYVFYLNVTDLKMLAAPVILKANTL